MSFSVSRLDNAGPQAPKRKRSVSDPESSSLPLKRLLAYLPWSTLLSQNGVITPSGSAHDPERDEVGNLEDEIQRQSKRAVKAEEKVRQLRELVEELRFEIKTMETEEYDRIKELRDVHNEFQGIQTQLNKVWDKKCFYTYAFRSWKGESRRTHAWEDFNLSDTDECDGESEEGKDQYDDDDDDDGSENDEDEDDEDNEDAATIQAL